MTLLDSFGTYAIFAVFILYSLYTLIVHVISSKKSLRNSEAIHRYFLVSGGLIMGLGISSIEGPFTSDYLFATDLIISFFILLAGLFLVFIGISVLKGSLWIPLEQITEYSAEFGVNFVATRLPLTGDRELVRFAERFNENAMALANKISELEIYLHTLAEAGQQTIDNGSNLVETTRGLTDVASDFTDSASTQQKVVSNLNEKINEFVSWYEQTQNDLSANFVELRSISERGNLISINAAVEASNLEVPNPGFETLAEELRDLARVLEERMENMKIVIDDIYLKYDQFKTNIQQDVSVALETSTDSLLVSEKISTIIEAVDEMKVQFNDYSETWKRRIEGYKGYLPQAFFG